MRRLIFAPIIHTSADFGTLADSMRLRGLAEFGEEVWKRHQGIIEAYWNILKEYFQNLNADGIKIYQDGLIANGEAGKKIVEDSISKGSENYIIIKDMVERGAQLVKTEDFFIVKKEHDHIVALLHAKGLRKWKAYFIYRLAKRKILAKRDAFIAQRVNQTLGEGETGVLLLGAYHNVLPLLSKDIEIIPLKDTQRVAQYQRSLLRLRQNKKKIEELSRYLTQPLEHRIVND